MLTIPMMTTAALPMTSAMLALGPVSALALLGLAATLGFLIAGTIGEIRRPHGDDAAVTHRMPDFRHAA